MTPGPLIVTVDLDWACEAAIEDLLSHLDAAGVPATVFATHRSPCVESRLDSLEVGLHPYFGADSSHGTSVADVIAHTLALPHNLAAFRCHRFLISNEIREELKAAGMVVSSNTCTDRVAIVPFVDRVGLLEVPIFLEDGGYLYLRHPLSLGHDLQDRLVTPEPKVVLLHPMHFAVNTPAFDSMVRLKRSVSRTQWRDLTQGDLSGLRHHGVGLRSFVKHLLSAARDLGLPFDTIGGLARASGCSALERYRSTRRRLA
jgi:hypothetical protein